MAQRASALAGDADGAIADCDGPAHWPWPSQFGGTAGGMADQRPFDQQEALFHHLENALSLTEFLENTAV